MTKWRFYSAADTVRALPTSPWCSPLYAEGFFREHLHLSARSFVLVASKHSREHNCQQPREQLLTNDGHEVGKGLSFFVSQVEQLWGILNIRAVQ